MYQIGQELIDTETEKNVYLVGFVFEIGNGQNSHIWVMDKDMEVISEIGSEKFQKLCPIVDEYEKIDAGKLVKFLDQFGPPQYFGIISDTGIKEFKKYLEKNNNESLL